MYHQPLYAGHLCSTATYHGPKGDSYELNLYKQATSVQQLYQR